MLVEGCPADCKIGDPERKKEYTYFEGCGDIKCKGCIAWKMKGEQSYYWYAYLDGCQYQIGHTVVVCGKHKKTISDLFQNNEKEYAFELMIALNQISNILTKTLSPKPEKIYVASLCDGQEHLHFHLIPRYPFTPTDVDYWFEEFKERDQLTMDDKEKQLQDPKIGGFWYLDRSEKNYKKSQYWKKTIDDRVQQIESLAQKLRTAYKLEFS